MENGMFDCQDLNRRLTPYIDGEMPAEERSVVEAHLAACPLCRHQAMVESEARKTIREHAAGLCSGAPASLQHRCRQAALQGLRGAEPRSRLVPLALAAALVLLIGGVFMYALTASSVTVLAAQLALDHVKCFAFFGSPSAIDAASAEETLSREYGWGLRIPREPTADQSAVATPTGLELVGARRCLYGEGALAHLMYRLQGRPLSLFMLPDTTRPTGLAAALGHEAVIWSGGGKTFVLMGRESRIELEKIAAYFEEGLAP
jgi:anti-sigma factor RsiW